MDINLLVENIFKLRSLLWLYSSMVWAKTDIKTEAHVLLFHTKLAKVSQGSNAYYITNKYIQLDNNCNKCNIFLRRFCLYNQSPFSLIFCYILYFKELYVISWEKNCLRIHHICLSIWVALIIITANRQNKWKIMQFNKIHLCLWKCTWRTQ